MLRYCSNTTAVQSSPNLNNSMIHYQSKLLWSEIPVQFGARGASSMWAHASDCQIELHWERARWCRAAGSCIRSWGLTPAPSFASWPGGPDSGTCRQGQGWDWDHILYTTTRRIGRRGKLAFAKILVSGFSFKWSEQNAEHAQWMQCTCRQRKECIHSTAVFASA